MPQLSDDVRRFLAAPRLAVVVTVNRDGTPLAIRYHGRDEGERMSREVFAKLRRVTYRMTIDRVYAPGFR